MIGRRLSTLLGLVGLISAPAFAQGGNVATGGDEAVELLKAVREVARDVAELRGEAFGRPPFAVRTPESFRRSAADIRALGVLTRDELDARGRAWSDLGFGGVGSPGRLLDLLARDVSGVGFDPEKLRLLVDPSLLTEDDFSSEGDLDEDTAMLLVTGRRVDEPLIAHVLMHLRQRERHGRDALAPTTDELLGRSAWAEGEANLVALRYLFGGLGIADDILAEPLYPGDYLDGELVPRALDSLNGIDSRLVDFVYNEGFASVVDAYREGGWEEVSRLDALIDTTRDVLHPDRADRPVAELTTGEAPADGLRLVDADVLGEQVIIVLISTLTGKDNSAVLAGDGWAGDRLERWEEPDDPANAGVTLWRTRWENESDAKQFEYGFRRAMEARFRGLPFVRAADAWSVDAGSRRVRLDRLDTEVQVRIGPSRWVEAVVAETAD